MITREKVSIKNVATETTEKNEEFYLSSLVESFLCGCESNTDGSAMFAAL